MTQAERRPAGTELLRQGDTVRCLIHLDEGVVKNVRLEEDGSSTIVSMVGSRSLLGLVALELDGVHDLSCECVTACHVHVVPLDLLARRRQTDPSLNYAIVRMLARERRIQNWHISLRNRRDAAERLARLLAVCPAISVVPTSDGGVKLIPLAPYRDLAGLVGITPQHFSRLLAAWERRGVIRREPHGWMVPPGNQSLLRLIQRFA
jgi:CRP-like cAMP-binding protein